MKKYGCVDYRSEMILVGLKKKLTKEKLSEKERKEIEKQVKELEKQMGLN